jgi:glutamate-1-semialdehyde 2,1-aminomutase
MSAVRLARGYTGRNLILKFEGCYHGHSDGLLVKAGSGALTTGVPDSAGVPEDYTKNTLIAAYNDCQGVEEIFRQHGSRIAAVIVEPVAGNMGVVPPEAGFLAKLRELSDQYGTLLIFDEVITGFRLSYQGAQGYYGITPDLTVLGKIIGGGLPVGAYGGRREIMSCISPLGSVYQAGTLSGNPVAMAAGIATLKILRENPGIYEENEKKAVVLERAFLAASAKNGIPLVVNRAGAIICAFFTGEKVVDYGSAVKADVQRFAKYFRSMLESGIYMAPSQFEAIFISQAHSGEDLEKAADAIDRAFSQL